MSQYADYGTAVAAITNPATPPADLAEIAQQQPGLQLQVALHPAAYDGLLDWLAGQGNPEVCQAVAQRRLPLTSPPAVFAPGTMSQDQMPPGFPDANPQSFYPGANLAQPKKKSSLGPALVGALVGGVAAIGAAVLFLGLHRETAEAQPPYPVQSQVHDAESTRSQSQPSAIELTPVTETATTEQVAPAPVATATTPPAPPAPAAPEPAQPAQPAQDSSIGQIMYTNGSSNPRTAPGSNSPLVIAISEGIQVTVHEVAQGWSGELGRDVPWSRVTTAGGHSGWVRSDLLRY